MYVYSTYSVATADFPIRFVAAPNWFTGMDALWADGSGAGGLVDGYAEEGDDVSYTFTVRHTPLEQMKRGAITTVFRCASSYPVWFLHCTAKVTTISDRVGLQEVNYCKTIKFGPGIQMNDVTTCGAFAIAYAYIHIADILVFFTFFIALLTYRGLTCALYIWQRQHILLHLGRLIVVHINNTCIIIITLHPKP